MSQQADAADEWEFDLGETVVLLWAIDATGLVAGRAEFMNADAQYLVEHPDAVGRLTRVWVDGDAIDHQTTTTRN